MHVKPFRSDVPEGVLDDLRRRLAHARWPDALHGAGWTYGADLDFMRSLAAYWRDTFDWRAQERRLNLWPQFRAEVGGLGVHFIHARGKGPEPWPLVVTHGWPGSVFELLELIPLLTDPGAHGADPADAFDVVAPSLPGFGFSDRPARGGMSPAATADLWAALMELLGYARFGAQGGDFGAGVATWLGLRHPRRLTGIHLNYVPGSFRPRVAGELSEAERRFQDERDAWYQAEGGYAHEQATKPQTLAFGLHDSPVGLCAWIVEKFHGWSDCGGEVGRRFSDDELLANVTLYWVTETIHSSLRYYVESSRTPLVLAAGQRVEVPCGFARFPLEAPSPPREWVERGYDVRRWTEMPRGGHFAAMEEPRLLAEDLRAFFRPLRAGSA
jgi:pimeloyl-ACP methyl ester carboxylesterase